ncbi:MAG TPA: NF038122 family metalloprotease [Candidatus Binatia bacterium]
MACICIGSAAAADDGAPFAVGSSLHVSYASPDALDATAPGTFEGAAEGPIVFTGHSGALVINATFDSSITGDVNSAAIQAMINSAIAIDENLFNDPITVNILYRYSTTLPDSTPLGGALAESLSLVYGVPWSTYVSALTADATTANDATANASLPGSPLSTNILPSSAGGRAIGLSTPPALCADGSIGSGCPYDGIVTLNSAQPFKLTRPPMAGLYDALRTTEHEMDEVMGLGSAIGAFGDLRPQDLFSWSAPGTRNLTSGGSRYFSIDGGTTDIVGFNQISGGDFGDWLSGGCPQTTPYVQNAFACAGQASDVEAFSPEGINLDVIGYDLILGPTPTPTLSATPTPSPTATVGPLDHFTCYKAAATGGSVKFLGIPNPPGVSLVDQFGSAQVQVKKPKLLCAPTDANGNDPSAPAHPEHQTAYQIKYPAKPVLPTGIKVVDDFNPSGLFVDAKKPAYVFVPTTKSLIGPTPVPTPGAFVTDHFECYKVAVTKNTPKFVPVVGLPFGDQFGTMTLALKKPKYLCNPVDKNGEDPTAPAHVGHLLCYQAKQVSLPKFVKLTGIFVDNQFGSETLDAKKPALVCVPALTTP